MAPAVRRAREQDICVFIGRFQPLHSGHVAVILQALLHAEFVILVVGSAFQPRRPDANPFLFDERAQMIWLALPADVRERVIIVPMPDSNYDLAQWNSDVYGAVNEQAAKIKENARISLIGHAKDNTSFYLKLFPQWGSIDVPLQKPIHATDLRNLYLSSDVDKFGEFYRLAADNEYIPRLTLRWLADFTTTDTYKALVDEMEFYRSCHARWDRESFPHARNTVTVDPLIVQANHVLLIKRGQYPQKGTWALPGGHLETNETLMEGGLREGFEETGIRVPRPIFEKSFVKTEVFDAPRRDPRGRYVGHVFLFHLQPTIPAYDTTKTPEWNRARVKAALALPEVKGMDDAAEARWFHKSEIDEMREVMFLDHYAIIQKMTASLPKEWKEAA